MLQAYLESVWMLSLRFLARVKALVRAISSACWEVAEVKLQLSGSHDCDKVPLDDGKGGDF